MIADARSLYELVLAQMAAECYFDGVALDDEDAIKSRLNQRGQAWLIA
jgi:hypothetical protein